MNDAEFLLWVARSLDYCDGVMLYGTDGWELIAARMVKALRFRARGPGFIFRALVEGWDQQRINREMY